MSEIFLARHQEQEEFKKVLSQLFANDESELPHVFLFSGEGGMGKTKLLHRLEEIAQRWQPYEGAFNSFYVDWEVQRGISRDLEVGHDHIRPESVLEILHNEVIREDRGAKFAKYNEVVKSLKESEARIDKKLNNEPKNELYARLRKYGAKGIALLIRSWIAIKTEYPETLKMIPQEPVEEMMAVTLDEGAQKAKDAYEFVQSTLEPEEFDIYLRPHERLAAALGEGIRDFTKGKRVIFFLDTYEIVDRPECDYTLREVMKRGGGRVIWVIAGRAKLGDSERRGDTYFRGYRQDFPEELLFTKSLSEFGPRETREYFHLLDAEREISENEAEKVSQFTFGMPFAISAAAAIWKEGTSLKDIVAPLPQAKSDQNIHALIVKQISERFLKHCIGADQGDVRAIYALAIMRRPNVDLFNVMLNIVDPEKVLQSLHERYSFIWVDEMRLDVKIANFLNEYILTDVRRKGPDVQGPNARAIEFLEKQLAERTADLPRIEDRIGTEAITEFMSDLIHHLFWKSEEDGWRYLVPRFVEALQYDPPWAHVLAEIASKFETTFSKEGLLLLQSITNGTGASPKFAHTREMLDHLQRHPWHKLLSGEEASERNAIMLYQYGMLLERRGKAKEALGKFLESEKDIPSGATSLVNELANAYESIGKDLSWEEGDARASLEALTALSRATALDPSDASKWRLFARIQLFNGEEEHALLTLEQAKRLAPEDDDLFEIFGDVYLNLGLYSEAIVAYTHSVELNPSSAASHYGLGEVLAASGKWEGAISEYGIAIKLTPQDGDAFNTRGWAYLHIGDLDHAKQGFEDSLNVKRNNHHALFNLGLVQSLKGELSDAQRSWQMALTCFRGNTQKEELNRSILNAAAGNIHQGLNQLRRLTESDLLPLGLLEYGHRILEILLKCPVEIPGLAQMGEILKKKINELENNTGH